MRYWVFLLLFWLSMEAPALATWSVIAVDTETGRVVISSATCTGRTDDFLKDLQAVVVPGRGVAACQAGADGSHQNQSLVFQEIRKGTDPKRIIELLSQDPSFQRRQFAIVDLEGRAAGHSGLGNGYVSQDIQGRVPGTGIYYSIQGNILRPGEVVPAGVEAFVETEGGITDRVMAAMEAADAAGGDGRCTCEIPEIDPQQASIACDGRTSLVAYILAADPDDPDGPLDAINWHNNGDYAMYITLSQGSIRAGENLNPVRTLRMRYDAWIAAHPDFER